MAMTYFKHAQALVDEGAVVGEGTRIWAFAHVLAGAHIGEHCNVGECVFVEGGVVVGNGVTLKNGVQLWTGVRCEDQVFIGPNATFTNDLRPRAFIAHDPSEFAKTLVCRGASIGANATVVAGVTIGRFAMVGAGSVVARDVGHHALVVGNPALPRGFVCECARKLSQSLRCDVCELSFVETPKGLVKAAVD